jgi:hypothetical protein
MNDQIHKSTLRVCFMACNASLGALCFGYTLGYMNVSLDIVDIVFQIPEEE